MPIITNLVQTRGPYPRIRVYLDGRYAFSVELEAGRHLKKEQHLSEEELEDLARASQGERALAMAMRMLVRRPYSRQEIEQRLAQKHFDQETIVRTLDALAARGLLDDAGFARFWCENRDAFRPRSRALVALELRRKGIAAVTINEATVGMDDEASAFQAGEKKARTLGQADHDTFYRRLGDYLRRRGYNYDVIKITVDKLWQIR